MSTLSSSSTDAEVEAAYDDNASYAEDDSLAKARAFVTAVRILIRRTPQISQKGGIGGGMVQFDPDQLRKELDEARRFIAAKGTGARVRHADLREFRD